MLFFSSVRMMVFTLGLSCNSWPACSEVQIWAKEYPSLVCTKTMLGLCALCGDRTSLVIIAAECLLLRIDHPSSLHKNARDTRYSPAGRDWPPATKLNGTSTTSSFDWPTAGRQSATRRAMQRLNLNDFIQRNSLQRLTSARSANLNSYRSYALAIAVSQAEAGYQLIEASKSPDGEADA
jgi:hypothetical protein